MADTVYATELYYQKGYGDREIGRISARSLPELRSKILWKMDHPNRYYPGYDVDSIRFHIGGRKPGVVCRKKGKIVWEDGYGAYHSIR